jgi:riboflavin kinase/FMN adenylyltransferase
MKVTLLPDVDPGSGPRSVAIGTFDGVHLGHREVIGGSDTVLTFDPHPLAVIHPEATPKLLNTFAVKRDLLADLGVDELVVIPFDRAFSEQSAEDFVHHVLIDKLRAERVSVGENFRFGKGAKGTEQLLRAHSEFETHVTPLVEVAGETVSSTQIRGLVAAGEVRQAAAFLGRPFLFEGQVVEGDRRGRELGMPTANLVPDDRLVTPGHGVYAAWAYLMPSPAHPAEPGASGHPSPAHPAEPGASGHPSPAHPAEPGASGHPAAVNVGVRPTFATGRGLLVEAHLIGFEGDIYGQTLRIAFLERMRGERAFESVDALVAQMNRDVEQARDITERTSYRVA